MNFFGYRGGHLFVEKVSIASIAESVGTPFFCYSSSSLEHQYLELKHALDPMGVKICYAVKANSNQAVIKTFANLGSGADIVSKGELIRALDAGITPDKIVFSGVGKTRDEIRHALEVGVGQFNIESPSELELISNIAQELKKTATVALRVNPDVDAQTHDKISTGRKADKFGIDIDLAPALYTQAAQMPGINMVGLALHIGSQLISLTPFRDAFERIAILVQDLRAAGASVKRLDLGGGLGVTYTTENPPDIEDYAQTIRSTVSSLKVELTVEPGRFLVANAGILVARVLFIKNTPVQRFVIVDGAMNDFIRPTLYNAVHDVLTEKKNVNCKLSSAQVVGPVCETGDILARAANLPPIEPGALIAIASAGAYGAVMGSTYNTRLPTLEVMVREAMTAVIRPRPTYEDILSLDHLPNWL
ncbi:MAG: diaminopimelate decarboxylase [Pseudomonadota bacterium]|nr:diaminopimelate decarboxylase [Pseudomonadota bacterium]MEC9022319.1 diaminopimelate decarboxylase [Pseudomonadota bacterium]